MRHALLAVAIFGLVACAQSPPRPLVRPANLYPVNEQANSIGMLKTVFTAYGPGHGTVELPLPSGETISGEYSIVSNAIIGFGSVFSAVYGVGDSSQVTVAGTSQASSSSLRAGQGVASGYGSKGTSIACEFYNDNVTGHGYGGCRMTNGALYRLQY